MNETELARALQTVGMAFFVRHIAALTDFGVGNDVLTVRLSRVEPKIKTVAMRISTARRVIQAGKVDAAMAKISSAKVEEETAAIARRWRLNR